VIFDCDGVMFDSRQANINFYNHLRHHFGLPLLDESAIDYVHMHTADEAIRHIFRGTPYVDQALAYKRDLDYTPFIKDMIPEPGTGVTRSIGSWRPLGLRTTLPLSSLRWTLKGPNPTPSLFSGSLIPSISPPVR